MENGRPNSVEVIAVATPQRSGLAPLVAPMNEMHPASPISGPLIAFEGVAHAISAAFFDQVNSPIPESEPQAIVQPWMRRESALMHAHKTTEIMLGE